MFIFQRSARQEQILVNYILGDHCSNYRLRRGHPMSDSMSKIIDYLDGYGCEDTTPRTLSNSVCSMIVKWYP